MLDPGLNLPAGKLSDFGQRPKMMASRLQERISMTRVLRLAGLAGALLLSG